MTCQSIEHEQLTSQTAYLQEQTEELVEGDRKVPVLLKGWSSTKGKPSGERNEIATALLARDWKGFDNYGSNGVLEVT